MGNVCGKLANDDDIRERRYSKNFMDRVEKEEADREALESITRKVLILGIVFLIPRNYIQIY
jgi:hypothetical protein